MTRARPPDDPRNDDARAVAAQASGTAGSAEKSKDSTIIRDDDTRRRLNAELRAQKPIFSAEAADALKGVPGAGNRAMAAHLEIQRIRQELARIDDEKKVATTKRAAERGESRESQREVNLIPERAGAIEGIEGETAGFSRQPEEGGR